MYTFHKEHNQETKYLILNHKVNLSILQDLHNMVSLFECKLIYRCYPEFWKHLSHQVYRHHY